MLKSICVSLMFSCLFLQAAPSVALSETFLGRNFEVFDGRSDKNKSAPTLIAMHGFLGTPRNMRSKTQLNQIAREQGIVVVYPRGRKRKWNDGRSPSETIDDVGYISALTESLVRRGITARNQVYLAGHSNGGGMAMRLACEKPRQFKGIAVIATKIPQKFQCRTGAPVPAIFFHGTKDPIAPHNGRPASSRLGGTLSSEATIEVWRNRNRCSGNRSEQTIDRMDDGTRVRIFGFKGCRAPLMFVLIEGHGHDWPRRGARPTRLQGPATQEINASQVLWRFFSSL